MTFSSDFGVRVMLVSENELGSIPPIQFFSTFCRTGIDSVLNTW